PSTPMVRMELPRAALRSSAHHPVGLSGIKQARVSSNKRNLDSNIIHFHCKHEAIFLFVQLREIVA
ncbi:hypothetical protein, partial [Pseudomonas aeruginosa]|uniref:hypothetical protein n=1 Tax=Pseudomonas aeruginosa TaxID=287 RepID=UPI00397AF60C